MNTYTIDAMDAARLLGVWTRTRTPYLLMRRDSDGFAVGFAKFASWKQRQWFRHNFGEIGAWRRCGGAVRYLFRVPLDRRETAMIMAGRRDELTMPETSFWRHRIAG